MRETKSDLHWKHILPDTILHVRRAIEAAKFVVQNGNKVHRDLVTFARHQLFSRTNGDDLSSALLVNKSGYAQGTIVVGEVDHLEPEVGKHEIKKIKRLEDSVVFLP